MVRLSQPPLSSLGVDRVTVNLSVGRRDSRPKATAKDVEPRNDQEGKGRCFRSSRRQYWTVRDGEYSLAPRGRRSWHAIHRYGIVNLGDPAVSFLL
ncbi:MAG: hypothetical protein H6Q68_3635 [Firmicutes bacterium]|nr:hypothetical protein [Bacillota bacterium]